MICLQCCGFDDQFNEKMAAKQLRSYHKKGACKSTQMLIDAIAEHDTTNATLLDIGGGIGIIQHELLKAGAANSNSIDGSKAYLQIAEQEAKRQGNQDNTQFQLGDFVDMADEIQSADIVTLDRVVCCYPDMHALVSLSAEKAHRIYGLVYPRDNWLMKGAGPTINLINRLRRIAFRFYPHKPEDIDQAVLDKGFKIYSVKRTLIWQIVLYTRN